MSQTPNARPPARPCRNHAENLAVSFCVRCGSGLCPACVFYEEQRALCEDCARLRRQKRMAEAVDRLRPAAEAAKGAAMSAAAPFAAKEVRRIYARLIDFAIILFFSWPLSFLAQFELDRAWPEVEGFPPNFSFFVAATLFASLFFVGFHGILGRTPGKMIMRLRVARADGSNYSVWLAIWRWIGFLTSCIWFLAGAGLIFFMGKILSVVGFRLNAFFIVVLYGAALLALLIFGAGLIITFLGARKRGFHDLVGDSVVINQPPESKRRAKHAASR